MRAALFRRHGGPEVHGDRRRPDAEPGPGRGAGAGHRRGAEPHRPVAAAGAAGAARRACRTSRAATCAASSRRWARASQRDAGRGEGDRVRRQPGPVVRPLRRLPRRARQLLPRLQACWASRPGAGRPSTSSFRPRTWCRRRARACRSTTPQLAAMPIAFMTAWQMLVDRARDPAGRDGAGARGRLGRRHRGDPDRQALRRARDRDRVDRREAGGGARAGRRRDHQPRDRATSSPR